jgi:hypothetical protein
LEAAGQALSPRIAPRDARRLQITLERETPAIKNFSALVGRPLDVTDDRAVSVGTRSVSLLRPGAPLVEAVRNELDAEPEGQTCAVWAPVDADHAPMIAIRCDLRVEADPTSAYSAWAALEASRPRDWFASRTDADAPLVLAALRRRVDAHLPPQPVSLWLDRDAYPIDDPALVSAYDSALQTGEDLGRLDSEARDAIARAFGALTLEDLLKPIPQRAVETARASEAFRDLTERAARAAGRDWETRERILSLRRGLNASASTEKDLAGEREVARTLLEAIRRPEVRWTGAALLIRTPSPPRR